MVCNDFLVKKQQQHILKRFHMTLFTTIFLGLKIIYTDCSILNNQSEFSFMI